MKKNLLCKKLVFLFAVVALFALSSVSAFAEITFEDGKLTGLEEGADYEYAYVTIADYNASLEEPDLTGKNFTSITADANGEYTSALDAGIICIKKAGSTNRSFVWIEGDALARSNIGKIVDHTFVDDNKNTVVWEDARLSYSTTTTTNPYNWVEGTWKTSNNNFYWWGKAALQKDSNPYLFATNNGDISKSLLTSLRLDPTNETYITQVKNRLVSISYKYAYQSSEIIPVEELYTFTFNKGVREGALNAYSPTGQEFQTKVILYTMNEEGKVTPHSWLEATTSHTGNTYNVGKQSKTHTISIPAAFPNATGYVVGIEVFPYAVLPSDVKFNVLYRKGSGDTIDSDGNYNIYMSYSFEYVPDGYTTKYKHNETLIPFQYNGANKAYIEGYGDGTFKPDGNITRAEISAIITRLISDKTPVGFVSDFDDVVPGAWYYEAVSYLENAGIFDYIASSFSPDEYITRGELAKIIYSFVDVPEVDVSDEKYVSPFGDVDKEYTYFSEIVALADAKIINGYEDSSFRPENTVTRAEAVTMINRLINLVVREDTVDESSVTKTFSDVSGHWAELNILVASNDNVKTKAHVNSSSALRETDDTIYFENNYAKITLSKANAKVIEILNKTTGTDVSANSIVPFFATAKSKSGLTFSPKSAEIVDGRLRIVFGNGTEAYFIVEEHDTFFTVELDSDIPISLASISFGRLGIAGAFSNSAPDTYRLSAMPMDTRVHNAYSPGGASKATAGSVSETLRVDAVGSKLGIAFARFGGLGTGEDIGEHRSALQDITDKINPEKGITSTMGGAYTFETPMLYEDYVITQQVTLDTLDDAIETAKRFSIEIFDLHQNNYSTFRQGDFRFYASAEEGEGTTDGATFKEKIAVPVHKAGLKLALHTYAAGVKPGCTGILSDPKWQKQFVYNDNVYILKDALDATDDSVWLTIEGTTENLKYPPYRSAADGAVPYDTIYTAYFLVDEEIISIAYQSSTTFVKENSFKVYRAQCGTKAAYHAPGAEVKQFLGIHQCLQPIPGSDLFWHIADLTAKAYNEADFDMIYLDGQEGFTRFSKDSENNYYYYAEFTRRIVSQCIKKPTLESSAFSGTNMWAAGGRYGAVDLVTRAIKKHKIGHYEAYGKATVNSYFTGTLGWFGFNTDGGALYKNAVSKTLFRDDMDYMGSAAIASNLSMVLNGFTPSTFTGALTESKLVENYNYYGVYSRLRKGGYFSPKVREELLNGEYEYKLFKQKDGSYAFREMKYVDLKVFDMDSYNSTTANNPFAAETPFVRIEQRYSTLGENAITLVDMDNTAQVASNTYTVSPALDLSSNMALKVNVYGNGQNGAILISLYSSAAGGRADYFVPTSHTGWKEFVLMEVDNNDYTGYSFSGIETIWSNWETYGATISHKDIYKVKVTTSGTVTGAMMDDILACTHVDAPATNPSVTIGGSTITFYDTNYTDVKIHSGEYIEYYPEYHKAYLNYYEKTYDDNGVWNGNKAHTKEIKFRITGDTFIVPNGAFSFSYNATNEGTAPLRAKVKLGLRGKIIANPADWEVPEINMGEATLDVIIK